MDTEILRKIQFINERGDLSNNKVKSLPTKHLVFVGPTFRFVSRAETKPNLVANIELLSTIFKIVISFNKHIDLVYSCLYILLQILSYESPLQHVLRGL